MQHKIKKNGKKLKLIGWILVIISLFITVIFGSFKYYCDKNKKKKEDVYISYTVTRATENENEFDMTTYYINLKNNKVKKVSILPYTSQYPLTLYNKKENIVYFSAKASDKKGDELFSYNCKTRKIQQLTQRFFAINYLYPVKDGIFIGAAERGTISTVRPFVYDKKTKNVVDLTWDNDFMIRSAGYNPTTKTIYVAGVSDKKVRKADMNVVDNYIYKINGANVTQIGEEKEGYINAITANKKIIYKMWDELLDTTPTLYEYNKGHRKQLKLSEKQMMEMEDIVYINDQELYCICSVEENDGVASQLCMIDLKTREKKILFETKGLSKINNAQIVKQ